jgi:hypothetical protein
MEGKSIPVGIPLASKTKGLFLITAHIPTNLVCPAFLFSDTYTFPLYRSLR